MGELHQLRAGGLVGLNMQRRVPVLALRPPQPERLGALPPDSLKRGAGLHNRHKREVGAKDSEEDLIRWERRSTLWCCNERTIPWPCAAASIDGSHLEGLGDATIAPKKPRTSVAAPDHRPVPGNGAELRRTRIETWRLRSLP